VRITPPIFGPSKIDDASGTDPIMDALACLFYSPTMSAAELRAAVARFRELADRADRELMSLPPGVASRAGVRPETLGIDDPALRWLAACHDILGPDCPANPMEASARAIDRILGTEG
jgi:hypothetical protein